LSEFVQFSIGVRSSFSVSGFDLVIAFRRSNLSNCRVDLTHGLTRGLLVCFNLLWIMLPCELCVLLL